MNKIIITLTIAMAFATSFAYASDEGIGFSTPPDFPDPRTVPSVELDYENGYLVVTKVYPDSVISLVQNGIERIHNTDKVKFPVSNQGCYTVEEKTEFTWQKSNQVCNDNGTFVVETKWDNYVDKRTTIHLKNEIDLIILPKQTDMKLLSGCPTSYNEDLVSCYRKGGYEDDDKKFIISSWETITPFAIEHELRHADCDCNFHD